MKKNRTRFISQPKTFVGGTKICGRKTVNPNLSREKAMNPEIFLRVLWAAFGAPRAIDGGYSYNILDTKTNVWFRAYSSASGPSYGGSLDFFKKPITGELVLEMKQILIDFEFWLSKHPLTENLEILLKDNN